MLRSNTNYDIVLNAVAAGFVLELDEAAFKIFMPVAVKHLSLQENLPPLGLTWGEVKADWAWHIRVTYLLIAVVAAICYGMHWFWCDDSERGAEFLRNVVGDQNI